MTTGTEFNGIDQWTNFKNIGTIGRGIRHRVGETSLKTEPIRDHQISINHAGHLLGRCGKVVWVRTDRHQNGDGSASAFNNLSSHIAQNRGGRNNSDF